MPATMTLLDQLLSPACADTELEREDDLQHREPAPRFGGGPTLDEILASAWEGLAAGRLVPCPVCVGAMTPRHSAGPRPVAACCADCGTELS